jgi:Amidohydrolase
MGVNVDLVKAGKLADAIEQTASLAKYPNVSVKLSAAPNYSTETYPFRDFTPHIRRLFDAYGPQRCCWGTDITNGFAKATTSSALPISPRSCRSCPSRTKIGSWVAPFSRASVGPRWQSGGLASASPRKRRSAIKAGLRRRAPLAESAP